MLKGLLRATLGERLPHTDGALTVAGIARPVALRRDAHGIAYIEAETTPDAFYGLGFAQGQDRSFQIELLVRAARGTLAALVGRDMLAADQLARRVGFARIAHAQLAAQTAEARAHAEAFARGVNAGRGVGLPRPPHELTILRTKPTEFHASDAFAVTAFVAFALSSNWDAELARLHLLLEDGPDALAALEAADPAWITAHEGDRLAGDVAVLRAARALTGAAATAAKRTGATSGSNAWVLAPSKTATGRAMLVCDPHLGPSLPAPWYLAHLRAPGWAMSGAFFVTQPMPSCGHNERVAWGITAGHADNTDLFLEEVGGDGRSVREGDRWVTYDLREERITVRGGADVVERVLETARGPIVSPALGGEGPALSLRGSWMRAAPMGVFGLYAATSCEAARAMMASHPALSENRMFADIDGHIAWQVCGDTPVRKRGSGMLPMPGWDASVGWHDAPLDFDKLPGATDPAEGFLVSANNRPAHIAEGVFLGADWLDAYRFERITERLGAAGGWDVAGAQAMLLDRESVLWRELREPLLAALAEATDAPTRRAHALLSAWDGALTPDAAAASVYALLVAAMARRVVLERAPNAARWALGEPTHALLPRGMMPLRRLSHLSRMVRLAPAGWFGAGGWAGMIRDEARGVIDTLTRRHGEAPTGWAWGAVRPLTLLHPLGTVGLLGRIWNLGPIRVGGDATTIPQASLDLRDPLGPPTGVSNLRAVLDVGAWEQSRWSLAGGQSGNVFSAHYADLLPRWERSDGVAMAWSPASVAKAAVATLRLTPAG